MAAFAVHVEDMIGEEDGAGKGGGNTGVQGLALREKAMVGTALEEDWVEREWS